MRKVFLSLLVIGMLLGGTFQQAHAQDKTLEFNLNFGALINITWLGNAWFTLGAGLDFHLGEQIMISSEFQLLSRDISNLDFFLNPGAILNLKLKNFFIGGGVIVPFWISLYDGLESVKISPKINAGFRIDKVKLTFYLLPGFDFQFEEILVGFSFGIVF